MIIWVIFMSRVKFNNWGWKPKIVRVFHSSEIKEINSAIEDGRISSEANRFILENGFVLRSKDSYKDFFQHRPIYNYEYYLGRTYYRRIWNKSDLRDLLKLLEISEGSSIKTASFFINFNSKPEKASTLVSNAKIHSFIFDKKIYKIESTNSQTYLRGSIFDLNDSQGSMMINWDRFRSLDATITSGDSTSDPCSDLYESLSKIDAKDKTNIQVLFKKSDIIKFICSNSKDLHLQETWSFPNSSIDFTYPIEKYWE